jgi:hypothetical protein
MNAQWQQFGLGIPFSAAAHSSHQQDYIQLDRTERMHMLLLSSLALCNEGLTRLICLLQENIDRLTRDRDAQLERHSATMARVESEMDSYCPDPQKAVAPGGRKAVGQQKFVEAVLLKMVIPRAMMGPGDALYAHYFGALMHTLDVPNWSSIMYWDNVSIYDPWCQWHSYKVSRCQLLRKAAPESTLA